MYFALRQDQEAYTNMNRPTVGLFQVVGCMLSSAVGSLSAQADSFVKQLSRISHLFVPPFLASESSRDTPNFWAFIRVVSLTLEVHKCIALLLPLFPSRSNLTQVPGMWWLFSDSLLFFLQRVLAGIGFSLYVSIHIGVARLRSRNLLR